MEEKEMDVIQKSTQVFMKLGIKSVTMDEIARQLGISKKTLYNYVTDKNDLVDKVLTCSCNADIEESSKICEKGMNAIDESFEISNYVMQHINSLHPSITFDLQKYHATAWEKFKMMKREHIKECYAKNLRKGIEEGLYRDNLNIPVIVHLYTGRFDLIFDEQELPSEKFKPADSYLEMFRYHIRGIASEKGLKYLAKKIQKVTTQS